MADPAELLSMNLGNILRTAQTGQNALVGPLLNLESANRQRALTESEGALNRTEGARQANQTAGLQRLATEVGGASQGTAIGPNNAVTNDPTKAVASLAALLGSPPPVTTTTDQNKLNVDPRTGLTTVQGQRVASKGGQGTEIEALKRLVLSNALGKAAPQQEDPEIANVKSQLPAGDEFKGFGVNSKGERAAHIQRGNQLFVIPHAQFTKRNQP